MQYEKPKLELANEDLEDIIRTSTPGKGDVGDSDNWIPLD